MHNLCRALFEWSREGCDTKEVDVPFSPYAIKCEASQPEASQVLNATSEGSFEAVVTLSDGRVTWREADDGLLLALKASGKTVAEIGEEMSRSYSAVASRLAHIRRRERIARRLERAD